MDFKILKLEAVCPTLSYEFKFLNLRDTQLVDILIISFHGKYRDGSAGRPDAGLIKGIIKTGLSVLNPFSLLIDLSGMEYNWGDDFDISFEEAEGVKTVVMVGDKCRMAMSTLAFGVNTQRDIVDNEFFFEDFNLAIAKLKEDKS